MDDIIQKTQSISLGTLTTLESTPKFTKSLSYDNVSKGKKQQISYINQAQDRKKEPKVGSIPNEKISPYRVIETNEEILACRFDNDGSSLALCLANGETRVYSVPYGKLIYALDSSKKVGVPITSLRFKPKKPESYKSVLITGAGDGTICHWNLRSGKLISRICEPENQILALDVKPDGSAFGTGGEDHKIRIYDENTESVVQVLDRGTWQNPGHSNRIFSLKFVPDDPNLLISGGWDNTILIWDLREGQSICSLFGHMISGDTLDFRNNVLLVGNSEIKRQLELWDFGQRKKLRSIQWEYGSTAEKVSIYSAQFSKKSDRCILACGSILDEARIFDQSADCMDFGKVCGFSKSLYTVDFSPKDDMFAVAGADGEAHIVKISHQPH